MKVDLQCVVWCLERCALDVEVVGKVAHTEASEP